MGSSFGGLSEHPDKRARIISGARPGGRRRSVAVVGSGISGLAAARTLRDHGLDVQIFDKGRGPGGRASTRRHEAWRFDHGAQYFTAHDERFRRYVDAWMTDGIVARWHGAIGTADNGLLEEKNDGPERYVGTPGMSAVASHLAADLSVTFDTRVAGVDRSGTGWTLTDDTDSVLAVADVVIVTAPPPQSAELISPVAPAVARKMASTCMQPCRAVMLGFDRRLDVALDGLFVSDSPLGWVCRNASKPGRPDEEAWVLHATPEWSLAHIDSTSKQVVARLTDAFFRAVGIESEDPIFSREHRWRYAQAARPLNAGCLWDADLRLAVCGDWCNGSRVEGAFLSGMAAAGRVLSLPDLTAGASPGRQTDLYSAPDST